MQIPIYSSREQLGSPKTYPVKHEAPVDDPWMDVLKQGLDTVEGIVARRQLEKDEGETTAAINSYRNMMRPYLIEEKKRQGFNAGGSIERISKAHTEVSGKLTTGMNKRVKTFFERRTSERLVNTQDKVASREATEHVRARDAAVKQNQIIFLDDINEGMNADKFKARLGEMTKQVINSNIGMPSQGLVVMHEQQAVKAYLLDASIRTPEQLQGLMTKYSEVVTPEFEQVLTDRTEGAKDARQVDAFLAASEGNDLDTSIKYIEALADEQIRPGAKRQVIDTLQLRKAKKEKIEQDAINKQQKELNTKAIDNFMAGNYDAIDGLIKQMPDAPSRMMWWNKLQLVKKDAESFNYTDPQVKAGVFKTIVMFPDKTTAQSILQLHGSGLSTNETKSMISFLQDIKKTGIDSKMQLTINEIEELRKDGHLGDNEFEARAKADELINGAAEFQRSNPKADVYQDYYEKVKEKYTKGNLAKAWDWLKDKVADDEEIEQTESSETEVSGTPTNDDDGSF